MSTEQRRAQIVEEFSLKYLFIPVLVSAFGLGTLHFPQLSEPISFALLVGFLISPLLVRLVGLLRGPKWIVFNGIALFVAAHVTEWLGRLLPFEFIVLMLTVTLIWDAVAIYFSNAMEGVASGAAHIQFPMFIIVPLSTSFSFDSVTGAMANDGFDEDAFSACIILGTGDLIVPNILALAAAPLTSQALLGLPAITVCTLVGACLGTTIQSLLETRAAMPALVGLVPGALAGFLLGLVVYGVPFTAVFPHLF